MMEHKTKKTQKRKRRARLKPKKLTDLPRLSVFRSNKYIYAQVIGKQGRVLVAANDKEPEKDKKPATQRAQKSTQNHGKFSKTKRAKLVGKLIAKKAIKKGIKQVVFDRGSYKYHGRVKALAEGAREGGLKF